MSVRVHELAKQLGLTSKELILRLKKLDIAVKGHMSALDAETAELVRHELSAAGKEKPKPAEKRKKEPVLQKLTVKIPLTVKELAVKLQVSTAELIKILLKMNVPANLNQTIEEETVKKAGLALGFEIERKPTDEEELLALHMREDTAGLVPRSPIVTFMGHVDHGKTSLLDAIRKSKLIDKESGGITQHIGAYEAALPKGKVTFLDTPGHEAFTAMRARGANVTDIVVLVVAADDGIMPQTREAIDHARAANVPIIVAFNKMDLPGANIDRVKRQLAEINLTTEDWGGKTICVPVSAKQGTGVEQLLEAILLEAEMLELKADPEKPASGIVVESKICKGSGPMATILVRNGTLRVQDVFVCGVTLGRVRAMVDDLGRRVQEAGPSVPVEVFGFERVPQTGDTLYVVADEKKAREISAKKNEQLREKNLMPSQRMSLEQLYLKVKEGSAKELKVIIKADVQGSLEAVGSSLEKLGTKDIAVRIIHSQVGMINESDVMLAAASDAVIIGFHVTIDPKAGEEAEKRGIDIRMYRIIYEAINDVRLSMEGLLEPKLKETFIGRARVLQVFNITKVGNIAGCAVVKGKIIRGAHVRLFRADKCLFEGKIEALKRFKDDVKEVSEGMECGISLVNHRDIQPDDIIECYHIEKIAQKL